MLKLRRGRVVEVDPLTVEVAGQRRRAWADIGSVGEVELGDEVIVNTVALDLELGSGGFDIVHVNLTRGLAADEEPGPHVIKLNYSSLQHPVEPVESLVGDTGPAGRMPVLILPLHGHLAPASFAAAEAEPGIRIGFVQAAGAALPGRLSRDVAELRRRGLLCDHITAGPCYGGEREAITVAGALEAAADALQWDLAIVGPGPGILGSATRLGHGGLAAMDAAHAALALGLTTVISPRLSEADPRPRHRGLSHHTETVLELLLAPVLVALPEGREDIVRAVEAIQSASPDRHQVITAPVNPDSYLESGLPRRTMGRDAAEDPLFFASPLAAGRVAAERLGRPNQGMDSAGPK